MTRPSALQEMPNHLHGLANGADWFTRVDFHARSASASELALTSASRDRSSRKQSKMLDFRTTMFSKLSVLEIVLLSSDDIESQADAIVIAAVIAGSCGHLGLL
ncbi:hypothetical protein BT93_L2263 [Corymbia citriodora subsp. variegata]|uniref:Uncharacterized protein n=1 Tax=Corymbia citriodora subsp. variegata TaxID=360336 RepID=A0A8T0CPY8_CORYI|nr:hypothetical protein BT93_L2263 [Corymbia citriodora subsp. variegata]